MQPSEPRRADNMQQYRVSRFIQTPCPVLTYVINQTAQHTLLSQTSQYVPFKASNYPDDEYKDGRVQPSISAWRIQPTLLSVWCAIRCKAAVFSTGVLAHKKYILKICGKGAHLGLNLANP